MRSLALLLSLALAAPALADDAETARALTSMIPVLLEDDARIEVLSTADVREMVAFEGEKAAMGCDEAGSCLAELADAMGAKYIIFGQLSRLGEQRVLTLNLFNSAQGASVSRAILRAETEGGLGDQLEAKLGGLLSALEVDEGQRVKLVVLDLRPPEATKPSEPEEPVNFLQLGVVGLGGAALIGAGVTAFFALSAEGAAAEESVQLARQAKYDEANGMWIATVALGAAAAAALVGGLVFLGDE